MGDEVPRKTQFLVSLKKLKRVDDHADLVGPWTSLKQVITDFWPKTPLFAKTQKIVFCKYLSI